MTDIDKALLYLFVGFSFVAFMVVDDIRNGRRPQRRDYHLVFLWPVCLLVIVILGLFEFSRLTSGESGQDLERPWKWL